MTETNEELISIFPGLFSWDEWVSENRILNLNEINLQTKKGDLTFPNLIFFFHLTFGTENYILSFVKFGKKLKICIFFNIL